jgi:hypothetical protein
VIISLIAITISVLMIFNFSVVKENGYPNRVPEILRGDLLEESWNLLKNQKGKNCFQNIEGCSFNTSSNKKVYIIGDSHMASLTFDLKDRIVKSNYQYITSTFGACFFYPGFNLVNNNDCIIYNNQIILQSYPEYRTEQRNNQNKYHYGQLWAQRNIYA